MRRTDFFKLFLLTVLLSSTFVLNAQTNSQYKDLLGQDKVNTITTAVPFLLIAPDARSGAMGDVGVATTPDINSQHWNPSKYAFMDKDFGFSLSYSPWLRSLVKDINLGYLTGFKKIGNNQAISASLLYFTLGSITFTDNLGNSIGDFKPNEFAVDLAYSRKLSDNFSGGIALRYIRSDLTQGQNVQGASTRAGSSVATDVSTYYQKKLKINDRNAKIMAGLNISNIGAKISYSETTEENFIPINMRIGTGFFTELDNYNTIAVFFDVNKLLVPTPPIYYKDSFDINQKPIIYKGKDPNVSPVSGMMQSFSDAPGGFSEEVKELTYSIGVEYWYDKQFAIRGGYFDENKLKGNRKYFTLGVGVKYNILGIDFSYLIPVGDQVNNPLENTLRFSLAFDFEGVKTPGSK